MMDLRVISDHTLRRWLSVPIMLVSFVLAREILLADGKVCVKRQEIGDRPGNLYDCDDLVRTECCERNKTFTCCEPPWKDTMKDQLWLLVGIVVIAILMCIVVSWCYGQSQCFRSPTAKQAAMHWKGKFVHAFDAMRGEKGARVGDVLTSKSSYAPLVSSSQSLGSKHEQV